MQISTTTRTTTKKSIVDMLMDTGLSKQKAENLYKKYKAWNKMDTLQEYIESRMSSKGSVR